MKCHIFCISIAFGQIISRCETKARDTVFEKIKVISNSYIISLLYVRYFYANHYTHFEKR